MELSRRRLIVAGTTLGIAGWAANLSHVAANDNDNDDPEDDISPVEDLMHEHGALERILLVYEECLHRLHANQEVPPKSLADAAGIVRSFVEDYHEKLEENELFPRFRRADRLVELVDVLLEQHNAGRRLTDTVLRLSTPEALKNADDQKTLSNALAAFIRMIRPHIAREDTVLFPAFRRIVSERVYDRLGDDFEDRERALFGVNGFEKIVDQIATIEKSLGIYDLAQFTARQ